MPTYKWCLEGCTYGTADIHIGQSVNGQPTAFNFHKCGGNTQECGHAWKVSYPMELTWKSRVLDFSSGGGRSLKIHLICNYCKNRAFPRAIMPYILNRSKLLKNVTRYAPIHRNGSKFMQAPTNRTKYPQMLANYFKIDQIQAKWCSSLGKIQANSPKILQNMPSSQDNAKTQRHTHKN